jgi:hypothetical protein
MAVAPLPMKMGLWVLGFLQQCVFFSSLSPLILLARLSILSLEGPASPCMFEVLHTPHLVPMVTTLSPSLPYTHLGPSLPPTPSTPKWGPHAPLPSHSLVPLTHKWVCVLPFFFLHLTNLLFPLTTTWTIICMPTIDVMPV